MSLLPTPWLRAGLAPHPDKRIWWAQLRQLWAQPRDTWHIYPHAWGGQLLCKKSDCWDRHAGRALKGATRRPQWGNGCPWPRARAQAWLDGHGQLFWPVPWSLGCSSWAPVIVGQSEPLAVLWLKFLTTTTGEPAPQWGLWSSSASWSAGLIPLWQHLSILVTAGLREALESAYMGPPASFFKTAAAISGLLHFTIYFRISLSPSRNPLPGLYWHLIEFQSILGAVCNTEPSILWTWSTSLVIRSVMSDSFQSRSSDLLTGIWSFWCMCVCVLHLFTTFC